MDEITSLKWVKTKGLDVRDFEDEWLANWKPKELNRSSTP